MPDVIKTQTVIFKSALSCRSSSISRLISTGFGSIVTTVES